MGSVIFSGVSPRNGGLDQAVLDVPELGARRARSRCSRPPPSRGAQWATVRLRIPSVGCPATPVTRAGEQRAPVARGWQLRERAVGDSQRLALDKHEAAVDHAAADRLSVFAPRHAYDACIAASALR